MNDGLCQGTARQGDGPRSQARGTGCFRSCRAWANREAIRLLLETHVSHLSHLALQKRSFSLLGLKRNKCNLFYIINEF